jgi:tRNA splicing endonuclease
MGFLVSWDGSRTATADDVRARRMRIIASDAGGKRECRDKMNVLESCRPPPNALRPSLPSSVRVLERGWLNCSHRERMLELLAGTEGLDSRSSAW